jgi:RNA polymerase sigma-70 factor (ECF subfamily)
VKGVEGMENKSVGLADNNTEIEVVIKGYSKMLFRICLVILGNEQDAEEALQDTYMRYVRKAPDFMNEEHEKAWLIRVATNVCKDMRRFRLRNTSLNIDDFEKYCKFDNSSEILERVMDLPPKYKEVILMHYIEGYKVDDISKILRISLSAAKKRLQYARERLKLEYERGI